MMYPIFSIIMFVLLIGHHLNINAIPLKSCELLLSKDEITFENSNNILSDSTVFDDEIITLHGQFSKKNISKITVKDLVLEEFHKIESILEDLDLKFKRNSEFLNNNKLGLGLRHIRAVPRKTEEECKLSHEILKNIKTEINDALQTTSQKTTRNNCQLKNDALSCSELIKYIECGINHLKNGFLIATSKSSTSEEFMAWKTSFETLSAAYVKLSDNINRGAEQMYKKEIAD